VCLSVSCVCASLYAYVFQCVSLSVRVSMLFLCFCVSLSVFFLHCILNDQIITGGVLNSGMNRGALTLVLFVIH